MFNLFQRWLPVASTAVLFAAPLHAATMAYVPNQKSGTVSVIDTATDTVVRTLSGHGAFGDRLQEVEIDPHGKVLYVVDASNNKVFAVDTASDKVLHSSPIGSEAEGISLSPDGSRIAVCDEGKNAVLLFNAKTLAPEATIKVSGEDPEHCVFAPGGKLLLTSNEGSNNLDVVDLEAGKSVGVIATSGHPRGMAFVPGTMKVYVAQETAGGVDLVDVGARRKVTSIPTGLRAAGVAISRDGKRLYVANGGAGTVSAIDVATDKVVGTVKVGQRPWNPALTPDGKKLYVANGRSNNVSVIDTATMKVVKEIPVGKLPWGVVIGR